MSKAISVRSDSANEVTHSILAIIVLYKMSPHESSSVRSLANSLAQTDSTSLRFKAILFDNGLTEQRGPGIFDDEVYLWEPGNRGLAYAYNSGIILAKEQGFEWLLTLDQDTSLPLDFLPRLISTIAAVGNDPQIAAIVPQIRGAGRSLSPYTFRWGAIPQWFPAGYLGIPKEPTYSLNSASLLRVSTLLQVGGYAPRFWLDASDHAIFNAFAAYGKHIYIAGNLQVLHHLSVLDTAGSMSTQRYENLLAAESSFWDLHMNRLANWERNARLVTNLLRQLWRRERQLCRVSLKFLRLRLLHSREYRLQIWEKQTEHRLKDGLTNNRAQRPKVSVCMATYNGERYIEEQIASVLPQLNEEDELVVVDDASSDKTKQRILDINDRRIRLIVHDSNQGVVGTFEHAVRSATGDLLFLCDGDDIWAPDKVEKVLHAFAENPKASIVSTGLRLIDEHGRPLDSEDYTKHREFTASLLPNLIRNRFQGSLIAFRSTLISSILPFPKGKLFLHDAWIGTCNTMLGGHTIYLCEPLVYYRRHANNFSQRMKLGSQIKTRLQLIAALSLRWFQL